MNAKPEGRSVVRSDRRWLAALADPRVRVEKALSGYHVLSGWRIPGRTLPEHLLYYVIRGGFRGVVAGRESRFTGPGLFWLPPGVTHELAQLDECDRLVLLNFRFRVLSGGSSVSFALRAPRFSSEAARLAPLAEQFRDDLSRDLPLRHRRLAALVFLMHTEMEMPPPADRQPGAVFDEAARRRLVRYAAEHARERPAPADLAAELRLTPDYFARVFRRTFGTSPRRWLMAERIGQAAVRLLDAPELTVSEVAAEFGYADIFLFSRQFKVVTGMSPSEHRAAHGR